MSQPTASPDIVRRSETRTGVAYGVAAYLWWGLVPVYFKSVASVPALEVLAHRVAWSVVMLNAMLVLQKRWRIGLRMVLVRRTMFMLVASTTLIAVNWLVFIWAVSESRVLEASLGYFINPLVNVLLGFVLLGERLRRWQWGSVALAAIGVTYLTTGYGAFPWVSLVLACSFGTYGLLRKTMRVDSLVGLATETTILTPPAIGYLLFALVTDRLAFGNETWRMDVLLSLAGVVTAVPLIWFAHAARRLRYATLGLLQYIAPSGQFLLAVLLFGETFTPDHMIAFASIWTALAIYSLDTFAQNRNAARP